MIHKIFLKGAQRKTVGAVAVAGRNRLGNLATLQLCDLICINEYIFLCCLLYRLCKNMKQASFPRRRESITYCKPADMDPRFRGDN